MSEKAFMLADALFRSGALKFGRFKLKSGVVSPYYIDLSWLLSSPGSFRGVVNIIADEIEGLKREMRVDKLATIELKGALLLPAVACRLRMPCIIVRKEPKAYGVRGRISGGSVEPGDRFVFFDDVITSGESKIEGMRPIEEAGGEIVAVMVVVDREQGGREEIESRGYRFLSIVTISEVIRSLLESGRISRDKADEIFRYIEESPL
ncbi:MAG: uridine monophosphate synthetase [Candidatus Bathyarchaeota archaeon B63]|nr:MAG: uridine monophosphate synthetase [Candidatus Bathyarchaeota archaeon B63]